MKTLKSEKETDFIYNVTMEMSDTRKEIGFVGDISALFEKKMKILP